MRDLPAEKALPTFVIPPPRHHHAGQLPLATSEDKVLASKLATTMAFRDAEAALERLAKATETINTLLRALTIVAEHAAKRLPTKAERAQVERIAVIARGYIGPDPS